MMKRLLFLTTLLLALAFAMPTESVHACTATPPPPPDEPTAIPITLQDRINNVDIVLLGTVLQNGGESAYQTAAEIQVERYYKGSGADIMLIEGFGSSSLCLNNIFVGSQYIFLIRERPDGTYWGAYFQGYSPTINPSPENIEQITAITNQSNPPIVIPDTATEETLDYQMLGLIASITVFCLALVGIVAMRLLRDPRKSKAKRGG